MIYLLAVDVDQFYIIKKFTRMFLSKSSIHRIDPAPYYNKPLPKELFNMVLIKNLSLPLNIYSSIPPRISNLRKLRYLELDCMWVTSIDNLIRCKQLRRLKMIDTKIISHLDFSKTTIVQIYVDGYGGLNQNIRNINGEKIVFIYLSS